MFAWIDIVAFACIVFSVETPLLELLLFGLSLDVLLLSLDRREASLLGAAIAACICAAAIKWPSAVFMVVQS
jgi:hypothetical protein